MPMNEPIQCPNCSTDIDAMPDEQKAAYENVPLPPGPDVNVLDQIKVVDLLCPNCGQKIHHQRLP